MRRLALLPLIGMIFAPAVRADDAAPSLEKLQGTWNVVRYVNEGKEETPSAAEAETLTIKGNHYEMKRSEGSYHGELKLNPSASPATIDATLFDTEDKRLGEATGIYKTEGDKLIICWGEGGNPRPDMFASQTGSKIRLITLMKKP